MTSITQAWRPEALHKLLPAFALLLSLLCCTAQAFDTLTPAQTLIYDTPHLANTQSGQTINYIYSSETATDTEVKKLSDSVSLTVLKEHEENKRDVSIEFLTGVNKLPLPDFTLYRGNPVIIAMLEYMAVSMGRDTGGGTLYFRNRIKDGIAAEDLDIATLKLQHNNNTISARQFSFSPFRNDSYLVERPQYTGSVFTITLSEEVPGGVLELSISSAQAVDNGFQYSLKLD